MRGSERGPRSSRCAGGTLALLHALLAPAPAHAEEAGTPRLSWQAPPACPDAAAVSERLESALGGELLEYGREWQIQGRVSASGSAGWQLLLEMREPGRAAAAAPLQRVLRAPACADLVEGAAVAIAIALGDARAADGTGRDPSDGRAAPEGSAASVAPSPAPPAADPGPHEARESSARGATAARRSLDLMLEALLDSGSVGGAGLGGSLGVGAWFGDLGLDVHGTWLPAQQQRIAPEQSAEFSLLAAGLRSCYRLWGSAASFGLAPCVGFELGRFSADSRGLLRAEPQRDLWLTPSLGVDLRGSLLGPLAARSRIELLLPLRRQAYRVDLVQPVHEIPALTVRWSVGVDADLLLP